MKMLDIKDGQSIVNRRLNGYMLCVSEFAQVG